MRKSALILIALIVFSCLRFLLIPQSPLHNDEAVYAEIIDEFLRSPAQILPHYLGNPISWKPPAGFYLYLPAIASLNFLFPGIPPEFAYRAAPAFFAAISTLALFFLVREFFGEREAFAAAFIFTVANGALFPTSLLLLDSALLLSIIWALHCYLRSAKDARWLIPAAAFSVLAALTKTYVALIIPLLALAYFTSRQKCGIGDALLGRKRNNAFLLSLLSVPAAMLAYWALFALLAPDGFREIGSSYIYDFVGRLYTNPLTAIANNAATAFQYFFPWVLLAPAGFFLLNWKKAEDRLLAWWCAISLIPLASSSGYFWYFLMAAPPLSILAARALLRLNRWHAAIIATAFLALSLTAYQGFAQPPGGASAQAQAGEFLAGKGSVLSLTETGVPTVFFYKFHNEARPGYPSVKQMVAEPYGVESYTAFRTMREIVFQTLEPNSLKGADAAYVRSLISSSQKENVLMDARLYGIYSEDPDPAYTLAFSSQDLQLFVVSKN